MITKSDEGGSLVALASGLLQVAKHVKIREITSKSSEDEETNTDNNQATSSC